MAPTLVTTSVAPVLLQHFPSAEVQSTAMHVRRARMEEQRGLFSQSARLVITEQPQQRFRFRYESELGGTHGQLAGSGGTERRSYPTVKLEGWSHPAIIRCELYSTVESSSSGTLPVAHVHTLQGKNCKSQGWAEIPVDIQSHHIASFQGLGIIHTAKKHMLEKIVARKLEEKKLFMQRLNTGKIWCPSEDDISEAREAANRESVRINMNRVCLRFQAFVVDPKTLMLETICDPVYSDPIYNGKSAQTGELKIVQLSQPSSPCTGNREIWLLVERVRKNDIRVRLFEEDENQRVIWCQYGRVIRCHHQYAIIFQTPSYRNVQLTRSVRVFIQLERPSDGCVSEPKPFQYTESEHKSTKRICPVFEYPSALTEAPEALYSDAGSRPDRVKSTTNFAHTSPQIDRNSGGSFRNKAESNLISGNSHAPSSGEREASPTGNDVNVIAGTSPLDLSTSSSLAASGQLPACETVPNVPSMLSLTTSDLHANQCLPTASTSLISCDSRCFNASHITTPRPEDGRSHDLEYRTPLPTSFGWRGGVCPLRSLIQPLHLASGVCPIRPLICMNSSLSGMHAPLSNVDSHDVQLTTSVVCNNNEVLASSIAPPSQSHTLFDDSSIHCIKSVTDKKVDHMLSEPHSSISPLAAASCYQALYPFESSLVGGNPWLQGVYNSVHPCCDRNTTNTRALHTRDLLSSYKYTVFNQSMKRLGSTEESLDLEVDHDLTSTPGRSNTNLPEKDCSPRSASSCVDGSQLKDGDLPPVFQLGNHSIDSTKFSEKPDPLDETSESSELQEISEKITDNYVIDDRSSACPFLAAYRSHKRFRVSSSGQTDRKSDSTSKSTLNSSHSQSCPTFRTNTTSPYHCKESNSFCREQSLSKLSPPPVFCQYPSGLSLSDKFRMENLLLGDNCDRLKQISCCLSSEPSISSQPAEASTIVSAAVST